MPRTMASAMREPSQGSSPEPSLTRPQRGSRVMSTMGEKTQLRPSAVASSVAARAVRSMRSRSQVAERPRGMGKMVR